MPDTNKPAKVMFHLLADAVAGKNIDAGTKQLLKGDLGGMSVNKRLMLATLELYRTGNDAPLIELLANMRDTGHLSLQSGAGRVASEAGSPGMHWSFSIAALEAALIHTTSGDLIRELQGVLLGEVGLCSEFQWKGQIAVPAPRVERAPLDGYRDVWFALVTGAPLRKRREDYWQQPESLAVRLMRDMVREGNWGNEMQAVMSPLPKLYLPIQTNAPSDSGWIAWIERTPEAEAQSHNEGLCDWVHAGAHGITYGHNWQQPLPVPVV